MYNVCLFLKLRGALNNILPALFMVYRFIDFGFWNITVYRFWKSRFIVRFVQKLDFFK